MTYTKEHPPVPSSEELRARIPGWGADLDPKDRPAVPELVYDPEATGAHWDFPERQPEREPRERSLEHEMLTPVFGATVPLRGLSGAIRRVAYAKYSEGRAAHWLLLLAGDRVDVVESRVRGLRRGRPDDPIAETGVRAEFAHNGLLDRLDSTRVDRSHTWMDPIVVAAPWVAAGAAGAVAARVLRRRGRQ
ncbi:MAG TPA: hypothetical protein VK083_17235 [Nocardia sp.]|uniref:hypothetical protein n=1 Tax=Nocardia TaxID=1817 RepID=UPI002458E85D|nr:MULTISPECIES: hypothetical protein [Nocardia]HLS78529.1 hypothetical protein [Nocardia sp.]